ncbi:MAG: peptidase E [Candidatus Zambryskibacteria bacterium]|nr:peptidase E [Candidatus Zambryskibacteria bacterium]
MTKDIFLLSMMSPLDDELRQTLAQEIARRGTTVAYISSNPQSGDRPFYQSTIADYAAISPDIHVDYFDLSNAFTDEMLSGLSSYSAIYLSGGNTFTFMDAARKRGLQPILEQYLADGGVLIGASAGSIMCTSSIELAKFGDENEVGMTDFSGFEFVDFEFHPHFTGDQDERERLAEYQRTHGREIYTCKDGAGLHISNSGVEAFGDVSKLKYVSEVI